MNTKEKITKTNLVKLISDENKLKREDVAVTLDSFFEMIKKSLGSGTEVSIRGFGNFQIKKRAQKIGRNVVENVSVVIPEHHIPFFKPSPELKQIVKEGDVK